MNPILYFLVGTFFANGNWFLYAVLFKKPYHSDFWMAGRVFSTILNFLGWPITFPASILIYASIKLQKWLSNKFIDER